MYFSEGGVDGAEEGSGLCLVMNLTLVFTLSQNLTLRGPRWPRLSLAEVQQEGLGVQGHPQIFNMSSTSAGATQDPVSKLKQTKNLTLSSVTATSA